MRLCTHCVCDRQVRLCAHCVCDRQVRLCSHCVMVGTGEVVCTRCDGRDR